ncbi:MAG: hypothetical protein U0703_27590 [Anaerolineae bacterium]
MTAASYQRQRAFYVTAGNGLPCLVMHGGWGFDHTVLHPWLDPLGDSLHLICTTIIAAMVSQGVR